VRTTNRWCDSASANGPRQCSPSATPTPFSSVAIGVRSTPAALPAPPLHHRCSVAAASVNVGIPEGCRVAQVQRGCNTTATSDREGRSCAARQRLAVRTRDDCCNCPSARTALPGRVGWAPRAGGRPCP
jgi:hypothetical protein